MKKIIVITSRFPYPVVGGDRLRIYQLCRELSKFYKITLLSLCETKAELNYKVDDGVFSEVHRIYLPVYISKIQAFIALLSGKSMQIEYYRSHSFKNKFDYLVEQHDACLVHLVRMAEYGKKIKIPKILEMTDIISLNYKRVSEQNKIKSLRHFIYTKEYKRIEGYERSVINFYDKCVLVSEVDKKFYHNSCAKNNIVVATNGVDINAFSKNNEKNSNTILFIGNMTTLQNMDACIYFAEKIMPILRQGGDFLFRVVGKMTEKEISFLKKYKNTEIIPNPNDISVASGNAFVAVAPIRLGAGVQNKVLEYMAMGYPTIVSRVAYEGLNAGEGRDLLVADSDDDWVKNIFLVKNSEKLANNMGENGFNYVKNNHDWSVKLKPVVNEFNLFFNKS